nr:ribonuclease H-like domain-containing protein [Tanacetum cinerariifolium]
MQYIVKSLGGIQGSHNQMNGNHQTIAYCLCWGLEVDIADILLSDLITCLHPTVGKMEKSKYLLYKIYLSGYGTFVKGCILSKRFGFSKSLHTSAVIFKQAWENETVLTSHMSEIADLSPQPIQSSLLPSGEEFVDSADASKSLEAQGNQPETAVVTKVQDKIVEKEVTAEDQSLEVPDVEDQIPKQISHNNHPDDNYDFSTKLKAMASGLMDAKLDDVDSTSDLSSMPNDEIRSTSTDNSGPFALIKRTLQDLLPGMLSKALQGCLPQLQKQVIKLINKKFNTYHVAESHRFVTLQKELSKVLKSEMVIMHEPAEGEKDKNAEVQGEHVSAGIPPVKEPEPSVDINDEVQGEHMTTEPSSTSEPKDETVGAQSSSLVVANINLPPPHPLFVAEPKELIQVEDSDEDDKQPLSTRFKISLEILTLTPLNSISSEQLVLDELQKKKVNDFTNQLFNTTSLNFSPTPPREPTPPRDPGKGKGPAVQEESGNALIINQSKKLGLSPPPELATFRLTPEEKKKKRSKMINQVFVIKNVVANRCQRNITPPVDVEDKNGANHINFFDTEYLEIPNDDERVDPKLNSDNNKSQSASSSSSNSGGVYVTAGFPVNTGNDADTNDHFATQNEEATTLEENIFLRFKPKTYADASKFSHWVDAMNLDMDALLRNGTWELEDLFDGRKAIGIKWIYKIKFQSSGAIDKFKARLVAQGFGQKEDIDYEETFSLVVKVSVRCLLNIVVS